MKEKWHFNFWDTIVFLTVFASIINLIEIWVTAKYSNKSEKKLNESK